MLIPILALFGSAGAFGQQAPYAPLNSLEAQVEAVGRDDGPSVANITTTVLTEDFFDEPVPTQAVGSGFVYDADGHVVTNFHVVENAQTVTVSFKNGVSFDARVVGSDPSTDLAVLLIDGSALPRPLTLGSSSRLQVGQFVVALGNPFGLTHTLTFGVVSALGRIIQSPSGGYIGEAIQTDTPINPGNSGGPLLALNGEVVGVNSQILSPSGGSSGVGFAIPVDLMKRVIPQLIVSGRALHPWLGIDGFDIGPPVAAALGRLGAPLPATDGVLVLSVATGGPADVAGIHGGSRILRTDRIQLPIGGDLIVGINGQPVGDFKELSAFVESNAIVGERVTLELYRDGQLITVPLVLAARP